MFTKGDIEKYFIAEKQEGLLFLIIGIAAVLVAAWFYFSLKTGLYKGAAVPLLVIGIIQFVVGFTVHKRSDSDRIKLVYAYDMDPGKLKNEELPRMKTVNRNFVIYRWAEIVLLLAGIGLLAWAAKNNDRSYWSGLAITLVLQAALMMVADTVAQKRARAYTKGLESFVNKTATAGEGGQ